MGLSERQQILARLLTDANLRASFHSDLIGVGQEIRVTSDDLAQLAALAMPDVERSARSLCAKRWNEIEKLLPLSLAAANQNGVPLRRWFLQFAQTWTPQGGRRHVQDALAFADWFAQQPAHTLPDPGNVDAFPAWLPDLMRYEAAWLSASLDLRSHFILFQRFRIPVHRIAYALAQNASETLTTANLSPRASVGIWFRWFPSRKVKHFVLALP